MITGSRSISVDVNPRRLRLAAELGATHTVNSADADATEAVKELTTGGADVAIETSGRVPVLGQAVRSLRSAGTCVVIGAPPRGSELAVDVPDLLGRGIRLVGTNQGDSAPRNTIPRLIDLYRAGMLPVDRIVTNYAFTAINQAAGDARPEPPSNPSCCSISAPARSPRPAPGSRIASPAPCALRSGRTR